MRTQLLVISLLSQFVLSCFAFADDLPSQGAEIVGKKMWIYYDSRSCRDTFKMYPKKSLNDALAYANPIEVTVNELNKSLLNWYSDEWYEVTVADGAATKAFITANDMNASYGVIKNLYYSSTSDVDFLLLKNACISNISPTEKQAIFAKVEKDKLELEKSIQAQEAKKKQEMEDRKAAELRAIESQAAAEEKLKLSKQNEANEKAALKEGLYLQYIKNLPNELRKLTKDEFCDYYGRQLRGGDLFLVKAPDSKEAVKNEAKRRNVKVNLSLVKSKSIRLGINTCQLYASWGEADGKNETVNKYGSFVQHVYQSGTYVYTDNDIVTSWQN